MPLLFDGRLVNTFVSLLALHRNIHFIRIFHFSVAKFVLVVFNNKMVWIMYLLVDKDKSTTIWTHGSRTVLTNEDINKRRGCRVVSWVILSLRSVYYYAVFAVSLSYRFSHLGRRYTRLYSLSGCNSGPSSSLLSMRLYRIIKRSFNG